MLDGARSWPRRHGLRRCVRRWLTRTGRALFISTPKGRNWFWQLWQAATEGGEWQCWRFSSYDNPTLHAARLTPRGQSARAVFAQEFMAEFLEDGGGVFRRVMDATTAKPQERAEPGHDYIVGVDWAKSADFTVLAVLDATAAALVYLDRFNQIDYTLQPTGYTHCANGSNRRRSSLSVIQSGSQLSSAYGVTGYQSNRFDHQRQQGAGYRGVGAGVRAW